MKDETLENTERELKTGIIQIECNNRENWSGKIWVSYWMVTLPLWQEAWSKVTWWQINSKNWRLWGTKVQWNYATQTACHEWTRREVYIQVWRRTWTSERSDLPDSSADTVRLDSGHGFHWQSMNPSSSTVQRTAVCSSFTHSALRRIRRQLRNHIVFTVADP